MNLDKLNYSEIADIIKELIEIQGQYPTYGLYQFQSLVSANQYYKLYQILSKYVVKGSRVLDWGCGNGHFSYFLLKAGYQTSAFSFKDFNFRHYLNLNQLDYEFQLGTDNEPKKIPFSDSIFDSVVSVGVLEHVRETGGNEVDSMQEIYRILKPGGYFICYHFPNQLSWIELLASIIPDKHHHEYRYDTKMIYNLCQATKLEILEIERYGFLPRNIWWNLPNTIKNSPLMSNIWNITDEFLKYPGSLLCQNYLFVAKKPDFTL
jgi:SAM-dependent methyltransferase